MRVRRDPGRSVVSGGHASQGALSALLLVACVLLTGWFPISLAQLGWLLVASGAAAAIGLGAGYRVVLTREGATVTKTWLGVPYRRRTYDASAKPEVYWAFEDRAPSGVVLVDGGSRTDEWRWIFGTPRSANVLCAALRAELAHVRGEAAASGG